MYTVDCVILFNLLEYAVDCVILFDLFVYAVDCVILFDLLVYAVDCVASCLTYSCLLLTVLSGFTYVLAVDCVVPF